MADIIEQLKNKYKSGNLMTKLIFINVAVFLVLKVINVLFTLFAINTFDLITFLGVPSYVGGLMMRFWTPFTYMFVHEGFLHILFNMLWLYWFGQIFLQYFSGRTMVSLYILGGLAGALVYVAAFTMIPYYSNLGRSWLIGASAAVMAIVMGAAFYRPDVQLNLLFLGSIKIVYIAIFAFVIDFLSLGDTANPGGHLAHIGGALLGYLFAVQQKKGRDITKWMSSVIDALTNLFKPGRSKSRMKVKYTRQETDWEYNKRRHSEQKEIDAILDKLKQSGYSNLTADEKKRLFDASKK